MKRKSVLALTLIIAYAMILTATAYTLQKNATKYEIYKANILNGGGR